LLIEILGRNNFALPILIESLISLYGDNFKINVISNIPDDENPSLALPFDGSRHSISYVQKINWKKSFESHLIIGSIGRSRRRIYLDFASSHGIAAKQFSTLVDPSAQIARDCNHGPGLYIAPNVTVAPSSKIGDFVVLNRHVSVGHHTEINDFVTLNPGATLCGLCEIGENVLVGAGATIVDQVKIGNNSIVGAGALVLNDVPADVVVTGVPAKILRAQQVS
jgi:sugar O-acyltransferase (sialic acid O-acetyltransferase NeuD family)